MLGLEFNPIQMGADFTAFNLSELEHEIRSTVDYLQYIHGHGPMFVDEVDYHLARIGVDYDDLPYSCKQILDELDLY